MKVTLGLENAHKYPKSLLGSATTTSVDART